MNSPNLSKLLSTSTGSENRHSTEMYSEQQLPYFLPNSSTGSIVVNWLQELTRHSVVHVSPATTTRIPVAYVSQKPNDQWVRDV